MPTIFIDRNPTTEETSLFQLTMSTYCDGSGQERDEGGRTRPGWRDLERVVAEVLHGDGTENKDIFDVYFRSEDSPDIFYGISVKSKQLDRKSAIDDLATTGRVHMEISNSPAKFWSVLQSKHVSENDFRNRRKPKLIGDTVLGIIKGWHEGAKRKFDSEHPNTTLNLKKSIFLTISYDKPKKDLPRKYQLHSFDLDFPNNIQWKYISNKCLRGYDPLYTDEVLVEWYGLSGGQLKYYPRASAAKFYTQQFSLLIPKPVSLSQKAQVYWPKQWKEALKD